MSQKPSQCEGEWYEVSRYDREPQTVYVPAEDRDRRLASFRENKFSLVLLGSGDAFRPKRSPIRGLDQEA